MIKKISPLSFVTVIASAVAGLMLPSSAMADYLIEESLNVDKGLCVGVDCFNGEAQEIGELRLKENNIRIRLHNTDIAKEYGAQSIFGESWYLEVNDSANGGPSYFDFQVKSVNKDNLLSDGTAKAYNCADLAANKYDISNLPSTGLVPVGGEIFRPQPILSSCEFNGAVVCFHQCIANDSPTFSRARVLTIGAKNDDLTFGDSVAIGFNSDFSQSPEKQVVALGYKDLKRQLVNLADALEQTDAVNMRGLKFQRVEGMLSQIAALNAQLDVLETRIDAYEDSITSEATLGTQGGTTAIALTKRNFLTIETGPQTDPWGPRTVEVGFYPSGSQPMADITLIDSQGNSTQLSGWWQQVSIPLEAGEVKFTLKTNTEQTVNAQWWFGWVNGEQ